MRNFALHLLFWLIPLVAAAQPNSDYKLIRDQKIHKICEMRHGDTLHVFIYDTTGFLLDYSLYGKVKNERLSVVKKITLQRFSGIAGLTDYRVQETDYNLGDENHILLAGNVPELVWYSHIAGTGKNHYALSCTGEEHYEYNHRPGHQAGDVDKGDTTLPLQVRKLERVEVYNPLAPPILHQGKINYNRAVHPLKGLAVGDSLFTLFGYSNKGDTVYDFGYEYIKRVGQNAYMQKSNGCPITMPLLLNSCRFNEVYAFFKQHLATGNNCTPMLPGKQDEPRKRNSLHHRVIPVYTWPHTEYDAYKRTQNPSHPYTCVVIKY